MYFSVALFKVTFYEEESHLIHPVDTDMFVRELQDALNSSISMNFTQKFDHIQIWHLSKKKLKNWYKAKQKNVSKQFESVLR